MGNGYCHFGWINTASGEFTGDPTRIYASNDQYVRYMTPNTFRTKVVNTTGMAAGPRVHYGTSSQGIPGILVRLPYSWSGSNSWMISFTLRIYQSYQAYDIQCSGYNYQNNKWYSPKAVMIAGTADITVKFGWESSGNLVVWASGGDYTGASVFNVNNGYRQYDWSQGIEIVSASECPNVQATFTCRPKIDRTDNVATATALQTTRTLWGQSFNGTQNVSGSLSSVSLIRFTVNSYEIGFSGNRLCFGNTSQQTAQGINIGNLLVSNAWADYTNVPTNGIWSKGDINSNSNISAAGYLYSRANTKYLKLGPQNTSYCHYETNTTNGHWFNMSVYSSGNFYGGSSYNRRLAYVDEIAGIKVNNALYSDNSGQLGGKSTGYYVPRNAGRDWTNGCLVITDLTANNNVPWLIIIEGNSYGASSPFMIQCQGYDYSGSSNHIKYGGWQVNGLSSGVRAFRYNGVLCFWFKQDSYWQGFSVRVYNCNETYNYNHVTSVSNSALPARDREVTISPAPLAYISSTVNNSNNLGGNPASYYATAATVGDISTLLDKINGTVV